MKRVFIGLIRDHRVRIGRIKGIRKSVTTYGSKSKDKDCKE